MAFSLNYDISFSITIITLSGIIQKKKTKKNMLNIFYSAIVTEVNVSLQRIANISNLGVRGGGLKSNEQYTNSIQIQGCSGGRRPFLIGALIIHLIAY